MSILTVQGLTKSYGEKMAIKDVCFSVDAGKICGLVGPNGAGKTTTVKIVVGLMRPEQGEVVWNGRIVRPHSPFLHRIGYMPDEPFIYDKLTGRELLRLTAVLKGMDRVRREEEISDLAAQLQLGVELDQTAETYSRGTRRKIGLMAGLLDDPDLLVLDEPTESLDPVSVHWLGRRLRDEASRGRAILVSTHNLSWADAVCTHVAILSDGQMLLSGDLGELRHTLSGPDPSMERLLFSVLQGR